MTATRLSNYNQRMLESLPVSGPGGLRALLKAEFAANNLSPEFLACWQVVPSFGIWVAGCDKATAVKMLLGEQPEKTGNPDWTPEPEKQGSNGHSAPQTSPANKNAVAEQIGALLASAIGGVNPETVRAQIKQELAPAIADFRGTLDASQKQVNDAVQRFTAWQAEQQKSVDNLRKELLEGRPVTIEVKQPDGSVQKVGRQHYLFPLLLHIAGARCHAYLVGPAGSGKTTACHKVADALKLPFYALSVCQQSTKTDLLGYMNATGNYVTTCFREAYERGGVFVLDEVDNGNANVIAVLNSALANDSMSFPDGMIARHKDFVLIAAGNTYGTGADRLYVGRNQLDAATLDRFCFLDFPYDEGFEAELAGVAGRKSPACDTAKGGAVTADAWLEFVKSVRGACDKLKLRHVVSPRATLYGVRLAGAGIGREWLESMLVWKGLDKETQQKVRAGM